MHPRRLPQPQWESQVRTCYSCLPFSSLSSPFPLEHPGLPMVFSKAGSLFLTTPHTLSLTQPGGVSFLLPLS